MNSSISSSSYSTNQIPTIFRQLDLKKEFKTSGFSVPLCVVQQFKKGARIYSENDRAGGVCRLNKGLIMIGTCDENGNESFSHFVFEGEYFGEELLVQEYKRNSFATVLSKTAVIEEVAEATIQQQETGYQLLQEIFRSKNYKMQQTIKWNAGKSLKLKLKEVLNQIGNTFGLQLINGEVLIRTHLKHRELALITSSTRQSVTTQLIALVDEQQIKVDRNSILLTHKFFK